MPRRLYVPKNFSVASLAIINQAERICSEMAADGYDITLRQLYYQFVSRGLIPNKDSEYKRLGGLVNDARLAGLIDFNYIVDRGRYVRSESHWATPADVIESAARGYNTAKWDDQPERVEVWIEKDALVGVLDAVCPQNDVAYFSCRGYTSLSEMWVASQRIRRHILGGQRVTILHLGDHDPSGIDMTRDIEERIHRFILNDLYAVDKLSQPNARATARDYFHVDRIALNMDQIEEYNPPPNPAKLTDSRGANYVDLYGNESWELDALPPAVLVDLIQNAIEEHRDDELWDAAVAREDHEREILTATSRRWEDVVEFLEEEGA